MLDIAVATRCVEILNFNGQDLFIPIVSSVLVILLREHKLPWISRDTRKLWMICLRLAAQKLAFVSRVVQQNSYFDRNSDQQNKFCMWSFPYLAFPPKFLHILKVVFNFNEETRTSTKITHTRNANCLFNPLGNSVV